MAVRVPPHEFAATLWAAWERGDAVLPLPWGDGIAPSRAEDLVRRMRPAALVGPGGTRQAAALDDRGPARVPDGTALVVATSGSTGAPKGVVLSHDALGASVSASTDRLGVEPGEPFVLALPLHHVAGIQVLLRARHCGGPVEIVDPGDLASLRRTDAGHVSLVATQLHRLLEHRPSVLPRWRTILVGGGPVDTGTLERAARAGARVVTSYGMTETCGGCVYDGRPLEGVEVAVGADRRIRVRGRTLFSGYLDQEAASTSGDGWFATADLGAFSEDGRLEVHGRTDDVVVTGGVNVPADAVARALARHPDVADAAVVGRPDAEWGAVVVAVVVPRRGCDLPTLEALRDHLRTLVPPDHLPRDAVGVERIPRDAMGKPDRGALQELSAPTGRITGPRTSADPR